jgi:hypothetical protein
VKDSGRVTSIEPNDWTPRSNQSIMTVLDGAGNAAFQNARRKTSPPILYFPVNCIFIRLPSTNRRGKPA